MQARDAPDEALEAVARQFATLFTQPLLKSMRDTSMAEGLFDNYQSCLYQDLFDKQMSTDLSKKKGMGLADVLIRQLSKNAKHETMPVGSLRSTDIPFKLDAAKLNKAVPVNDKFESPSDYLKKMFPLAKAVEKEHGIHAAVILAQSALETGWGKHIMKANDGSSSYNLFGIKADNRWEGAVASAKTVEFNNGIAEVRRDNFRSYNGFTQSMSDYAQFIKSSPRYKHVMANVSDRGKFSVALQQAGYATDPQYATKINKIMASPGFESVLNEFKETAGGPLT